MVAMSLCRECGERNPVEFYARQRSLCKACTCKRVRANRAAKIDYYRQYDLARIDDPNRKAMRDVYRAKLSGDYKNKKAREWIQRNPSKRAAHITLGNAVRDGKIIKPNACQRCFVVGAVTAHHPDYSHHLEVEWLCRTCHGREHRLERDMRFGKDIIR